MLLTLIACVQLLCLVAAERSVVFMTELARAVRIDFMTLTFAETCAWWALTHALAAVLPVPLEEGLRLMATFTLVYTVARWTTSSVSPCVSRTTTLPSHRVGPGPTGTLLFLSLLFCGWWWSSYGRSIQDNRLHGLHWYPCCCHLPSVRS